MTTDPSGNINVMNDDEFRTLNRNLSRHYGVEDPKLKEKRQKKILENLMLTLKASASKSDTVKSAATAKKITAMIAGKKPFSLLGSISTLVQSN